MKLSKRREYAMRALIDLGLAHAAGRTHLPVSELARYERIPVRFLEQLLLVAQAGRPGDEPPGHARRVLALETGPRHFHGRRDAADGRSDRPDRMRGP